VALGRTILLPVILAANILPLSAQDANRVNASAVALRITSREVVVDVSVTSNGTPIAELKKEDFVVFGDGKPQAIDYFEPHSPSPNQLNEVEVLPPHVYTNQPPITAGDAVTVWLLLDDLDTELSDQVQARQQIVRFLTQLQAGQRVAIYTLNSRLQLLQGFTSDRNLLHASLGSKQARPERSSTLHGRTGVLKDSDAVTMAGDAASAQAQERSIREYSTAQQGQQTASVLTA